MIKFRDFFAITHPFPIKTFKTRQKIKYAFVVHEIYLRGFNFLIIFLKYILKKGGARKIIELNGTMTLRLNTDTILGKRFTHIYLPKDKIIYKTVLYRGFWERESSIFLAEGISKTLFSKEHEDLPILIDVGAHVGIVTMQVLNLIKEPISVKAIEPILDHAVMLSRNLKIFKVAHRISIDNFALGQRTGFEFMAKNSRNSGAAKFNHLVPKTSINLERVRVLNAYSYFEKIMNRPGVFIKIDIEGAEASILSMIPNNLWVNIERAVIEITAIPNLAESEIDSILKNFSTFKFRSWFADKSEAIALNEIKDFWLGKNYWTRNLYLIK